MRSLLICSLAILFYGCPSTTAPTTQPHTLGTISGTVFDTLTNPVFQALLSSDPPTSQLLSKADGSFIFENVLPGVYLITAKKGFAESGTAAVRVLAGTSATANIIISTYGEDGGLIKGRVVNQDLGAEAGVSVTTIPPTTAVISESDGTFYITHVAEGSYTLVAEKINVGKASESITVKSGQTTHRELILNAKPDLSFGSLIAFYPFEEDGNDHSGNNRHLLLVDEAFTPSRFNDGTKALLANGSTTRGSAPHDDIYNSPAVTVSVWLKVPTPIIGSSEECQFFPTMLVLHRTAFRYFFWEKILSGSMEEAALRFVKPIMRCLPITPGTW